MFLSMEDNSITRAGRLQYTGCHPKSDHIVDIVHWRGRYDFKNRKDIKKETQ